MAHSHSKHTLSINLSNAVPESNTVFNYQYAIQGDTTAIFLLSGININPPGIQGIYVNFDGSKNIFTSAIFSDRLTLTLPFTSISHTYFSTSSSPATLSATFGVLYQPINGNSPLSATHIVKFFISAENVLDKNLELINTQIFTTAGKSSYFFNFETDENEIYAVSLFDPLDFIPISSGVFLNTDPETDLTTGVTLLPVLSTSNRINTESDQRITVV
jgi:hypothetical protein